MSQEETELGDGAAGEPSAPDGDAPPGADAAEPGADAAEPGADAAEPGPDAAEPGPDAEGDLLDDQADAAEDFVHDLLDAMGMEGEAVADIDGDWIYVDVEGPEMGVLIGRHGATLEALQDLVRATVQHKTSAPARIMVDVEGYRERQRERLERQARRVAATVRKERRLSRMAPMSSYERRIVHEALRDFDGVLTRSEGEGSERCVVILPA